MGEVRDKRVVVLGSIITAGQSGEGETSFVREDTKASELELEKRQQWGSPQRKCVRFQMRVYSKTARPRESSQHVLRNKDWNEKDKHVQGGRGPRTE